MPLAIKAATILFVTIAAMLLSPATLAFGVWIAGPGAPIVGLVVIAAAACIAVKTAVSLRAPR